MTKGIVLVLAVILVATIAVVFFRSRGVGAQRLSADEEAMRGLVLEVYGDKITAESVSFKNGDALMTLTLHGDKLGSLEVNLSSLARKHREQGVSLPVIKKSLQF